MDRIITDKEYQSYYEDENNSKIINKVLGFYYGHIPNSELTQLGRIALWNCLKKHNFSQKTKFTSSLWLYVKWECQKFLRSDIRNRRYVYGNIETNKNLEIYKNKRILAQEILDSVKTKEDRQFLESYFIEHKTYSQIAKESNLTKEFVRKRILKLIEKIKNEF